MSKKLKLKAPKHEAQKISHQKIRESGEQLHITFNFSFISNNSKYNFTNSDLVDTHKLKLLDRLCELSQNDIVATLAFGKFNGLESLKPKQLGKAKLLNQDIHPTFCNGSRQGISGENFWSFRLYPNNNPLPSRIIGKMIDHTFYVMFLDLTHELYSG